MMLSLSATGPTDMIYFCKPAAPGAIWKSPVTLAPSRERMKICVLPVVNRGPVADQSSTPALPGLPPRVLDRLCWHTDVAAPASIRDSFSLASRFVTENIEPEESLPGNNRVGMTTALLSARILVC